MEFHCLKSNTVFFIRTVVFFLTCISFLNASPRDDLIKISQDIRASELDMDYLNTSKEILVLKKNNSIRKFKKYNKELANSFIVLFKMNMTPLSLLLANDHTNQEIAISYTLLKNYNHLLRDHMRNIAFELKSIKEISIQINNIESQLISINQKLKTNRDILTNTLQSNYSINKITGLQKQHNYLIQQHNNKIKLIENASSSILTEPEEQENNNFQKQQHHLSWPNNGFISQYFKQGNFGDLTYNGIVILALANSHVVSPSDGEIVYVGSFRDFKTLIIIKHAPSYFSIISGDISPYVRITQLVKKDEPIAISFNKINPIYYEFQYKNNPIDPKNWLERKKKENNRIPF